MLDGYPKVYRVGHGRIDRLFEGPVVVQEKVDGSQFSFGLDAEGVLRARSHHAEILLEAQDRAFAPALATVKELRDKMQPGYMYRAEAVTTPKHNTLHYSRIPRGGLVLFDISTGIERYAAPTLVAAEAAVLGLEVVPTLFEGETTPALLTALLERESFLGGCKLEGVVVKNYAQYTPEGRVMMGKLVRADFAELNKAEWAGRHSQHDAVIALGAALGTPARWEKAVQSMREAGKLAEAAEDIGPLLRLVQQDILEEESDALKEALLKRFWRDISRAATKDLPAWYKARLMQAVIGSGAGSTGAPPAASAQASEQTASAEGAPTA